MYNNIRHNRKLSTILSKYNDQTDKIQSLIESNKNSDNQFEYNIYNPVVTDRIFTCVQHAVRSWENSVAGYAYGNWIFDTCCCDRYCDAD